jgi:isopenicillin N synthase-like dioxygenase
MMEETFSALPVIDISPLIQRSPERYETAKQLGAACREHGFFYISGHGVGDALQERLETLSRRFFARPMEEKLAIRMALGGRAWRGYFAVGNELTSGRPDLKEGIYFGAELGENDPLVKSRTPMHGSNLFPANLPMFRETVLEYMEAMGALGQKLMAGIALSLGLAEDYFRERYTAEPLTLFRIFNYPPDRAPESEKSWGVGEHTDYGMLTILKQDDSGGLQVKSQSRWLDAPPLRGSFLCNIGDMLDRMTAGLYRSTPHRVRNPKGHDRLSFPFFFDPNFNARVQPIELNSSLPDDKQERWDKASVHEFKGTYGEYLLNKVAKVFPQLRQQAL